MVTRHDDREFVGFYDKNSCRTFSDMEFHHCAFVNCWISQGERLKHRSIVRNVSLVKCKVASCTVGAAIIEDVRVVDIQIYDLLRVQGAVFKHVTLSGDIGSVLIGSVVTPTIIKPHQQRAYDKANAEYYSRVDWALDIREARFAECDFRGVPAHLVRRDPETQVIVTRDKALNQPWRHLDLSQTYWPRIIEYMLRREYHDMVLVAPKRNENFKVLLDGLKMLRDAGVAEPD